MPRRIAFACGIAMALLAGPAEASKCYVREYKSISSLGPIVAQIAPEPGTDQAPIDFSGGAASSAAFASTTKVVRLICDASCSFVFGASPQTATTNNALMGAGTPEYFGVIPGQIVSCRANP